MADIARAHLREADVLGCHGGEESAVLSDNGAQQAWVAAERIRQTITGHDVETGTGPIRVPISLGIAELAPVEDTLAALIYRADQAMYAAKRACRRRGR